MRAPFFLALTGCTPASGSQAVWSGYVLADPYVDDALLEGGSIELLGTDGACVARDGRCVVATDEDTPGYYSMVVEKNSDAVLRVSGPGVAPTVWRSAAPAADSAQWFSGGLYTRRIDALDAFRAEIAMGPFSSLAEGTSVWLWGSPLDPEAWSGADVAVSDGDGAQGTLLSFAVNDDGSLAPSGPGPVDLFVAFDLAPGAITLSVEAVDGRAASQTWPTQPGELVSAAFFALPLE